MSSELDAFERWELSRIINASGTMTSIGASRIAPRVMQLVQSVSGNFVDIGQLQRRASRAISAATGAEAGCVVGCSAAALTMSVAGSIAGTDRHRIEQLPDTRGLEHRVALQMGHMINYGAPVHQAIELAGAEVVPLGTAALCETYHLEAALKEGCAAAIYVISHHTVREGELPLDVFIDLARSYDVPVIVDAASEYDLRGPIKLGASLAIYSGHKFLGGMTSGIVAGSKSMVSATYAQNAGIGRTMKIGKEGIAGAIAALEDWETRDHTREMKREAKIVEHWTSELRKRQDVKIDKHEDWTGNPITRLKLTLPPSESPIYAWELSQRLANRNPSIIVRDDLAEHHELYLDPCNLTDTEAQLVSEAIHEELEQAHLLKNGKKQGWSARKSGISSSLDLFSEHGGDG